VTGYEHLAVAGEETGATTDDDHLLDPGRLKPREHQDAVEALLRQFRPAIVRYCRSRLAGTRTRTASLHEDDVAQEVCLALLSAEDTGYVLDMSPGAVRVAQHRALVRLRALAARETARS
jgi:DNA-directed RNA polymerase specialized sigma24 family protein